MDRTGGKAHSEGQVLTDASNLYTVSRVRTFNTCPRQHQYRYVLGWTPKEKADALARGTDIHRQLEAVYRGDDKESPLAHWHWKYDDLEPVAPVHASVERAIVTNVFGSPRLVGGVIDLVAINRTSGKFWINDHKSVERMYPFPRMYGTEQLGVYRSLVREDFALDFAGGCISRILYKPVSYQFATGYILRNLKMNEGLNITRTNLKQLEKLSLPKPPRKKRGKVLWLRQHPRQRSIAFRRYDEDGQIVKSLAYFGNRREGYLIHVERIYLPLDKRAERDNWQTFLNSMEQIGPSQHRTPGYHCIQCPFAEACESELHRGLAAGSCIDQEKFEIKPPNEEVLLALDKQLEV